MGDQSEEGLGGLREGLEGSVYSKVGSVCTQGALCAHLSMPTNGGWEKAD